jgi:hypothetical protein
VVSAPSARRDSRTSERRKGVHSGNRSTAFSLRRPVQIALLRRGTGTITPGRDFFPEEKRATLDTRGVLHLHPTSMEGNGLRGGGIWFYHYRGPKGENFGHRPAHLGSVEPDRDDGVRSQTLRMRGEPFDGGVARLLE